MYRERARRAGERDRVGVDGEAWHRAAASGLGRNGNRHGRRRKRQEHERDCQREADASRHHLRELRNAKLALRATSCGRGWYRCCSRYRHRGVFYRFSTAGHLLIFRMTNLPSGSRARIRKR